ncbi:MAG: cysteine desulfurase [Deltaproteobacteria bacterium]|nr:cysteine desulfurase [Deltaproteobacteria bacterium]
MSHPPRAMQVYLDNAATTRPSAAVRRAMMEALEVSFGNPSSLHRVGIEASRIVERAREELSALLGDRRRVAFTSGGTEADALAIAGVGLRSKRRHLVATAFEHSAVLDTMRALCDLGAEVTLVPVGSDGVVDPDDVARAVRADTALVAVMAVQNEIGTVQPIEAVARRVHEVNDRTVVHVDAVQAVGYVPLEPLAAADTVVVSAHKMHGPKGSGALLYREGVVLRPLWSGGGQEGGVRTGTQNVPGIAGLALAARDAALARPEAAARMARLRDALVGHVLGEVPGSRLVGSQARRSPANACLAFPGLRAEPMLHALEAKGIYVSSGSACHAKEGKISHVLEAIGLDASTGVIRVTLCRETTQDETLHAARALVDVARATALGGAA